MADETVTYGLRVDLKLSSLAYRLPSRFIAHTFVYLLVTSSAEANLTAGLQSGLRSFDDSNSKTQTEELGKLARNPLEAPQKTEKLYEQSSFDTCQPPSFAIEEFPSLQVGYLSLRSNSKTARLENAFEIRISKTTGENSRLV